MERDLSHLDAHGRARMVDVGAKAVTHRLCLARGDVRMSSWLYAGTPLYPAVLVRVTADQ